MSWPSGTGTQRESDASDGCETFGSILADIFRPGVVGGLEGNVRAVKTVLSRRWQFVQCVEEEETSAGVVPGQG